MYAAIGYGGMAATRAVNRMKDELARLHHASGKKTVPEKVTEAAERREQQASRKVKSPSTACWLRDWITAL